MSLNNFELENLKLWNFIFESTKNKMIQNTDSPIDLMDALENNLSAKATFVSSWNRFTHKSVNGMQN